jgi:hypothetical protein
MIKTCRWLNGYELEIQGYNADGNVLPKLVAVNPIGYVASLPMDAELICIISAKPLAVE